MNETITLNGIDYPVRRSARRKRLSVISDIDGKITVALPAKYKAGCDTEKLLLPLLDEIIKRTSAVPQVKKFKDGENFLYHGTEYPLILTDDVHTLEFNGCAFLLNSGKTDRARDLFERWYKKALETRLTLVLPEFCRKINVAPAKISVKSTSSIWGSCSRKRNITYCTRLALLPDRLFEYIVVHELCHLLQMNHSPEFWYEVAKFIPDYKERRAELNKNGNIYKWW